MSIPCGDSASLDAESGAELPETSLAVDSQTLAQAGQGEQAAQISGHVVQAYRTIQAPYGQLKTRKCVDEREIQSPGQTTNHDLHVAVYDEDHRPCGHGYLLCKQDAA